MAGLKEQSNTGEVLFFDLRRAFDGAGRVDVADDGVGLIVIVSQLEQRRGHGVVHDLDHAAADQLLVFHQRQVGLDAGGVAIHEESDGAGGSENGDLGIAVAELLAVGESFVPAGFGGGDEFVELSCRAALGRRPGAAGPT